MVVLLLKDKLLSNGVPWKNTEPLGPLASLQYGLSPENESNHLDWLFLAIDNLSRLINSNLTQLEQRLNDNDTGLAQQFVALRNYIYKISDGLAQGFIVIDILFQVDLSLGNCLTLRNLRGNRRSDSSLSRLLFYTRQFFLTAGIVFVEFIGMFGKSNVTDVQLNRAIVAVETTCQTGILTDRTAQIFFLYAFSFSLHRSRVAYFPQRFKSVCTFLSVNSYTLDPRQSQLTISVSHAILGLIIFNNHPNKQLDEHPACLLKVRPKSISPLIQLLDFKSRIQQIYQQQVMFLRQFKAIMTRNWIANRRTKEWLRQNISVLILSIFIIVTERTSANRIETPFYMGIAIAGYSRTVAVWWLTEKQTHQKELQKIMGVQQLSYILSWIVYFIMNGLLVSVVMMIIIKSLVITDQTQFAEGYGFEHIALLYFLYTIANIGYVLIMCSFFSSAKTGSQAITFIQLIINFLYFLRFSNDVAQSAPLVVLLSIFPQLCFNMTISKIAFLDSSLGQYSFDITYGQGIATMFVVFIIFTVLALYLDQVVPNQMGTHKHPLFFIGVASKNNQIPLNEQLLPNVQEGFQSSAKYEYHIQHQSPPLAKMTNVSKSFGDHLVIDNLSIKFYQSQIFCLLGHNGAGKSTTINLLTGLLSANSGSIQIMGLRYPEDIDEIRKNIGLCLQYNVLYDSLTIQQHLQFYYRIKNQNDDHMDQQVANTIAQCALINQKGKLAKNLSGGNKRKLCLANSLIGGSRLIFLDQPSSGLDPNSRQSIWAILKNIQSQNRCIILTTHHLEEAEHLSKRIAIMSKGKLIIVGNKQFITDKFSVGYHVVITLNKLNSKSAEITRDIISKNISRSVEDKQAASNTLKFIFPLSELHKFSTTLKALEDAQVGSISVYMSNLQDAFVKIGEQEENFNEGFQLLNGSQPSQSNDDKGMLNSPVKIQQLRLPQVQCHYSFCSQFYAVFLRKMKTTVRSFSSVVSIIMPSAFMCIGVLVVCIAIKEDPYANEKQRVGLERVRLFIMSYFMIWAFVFCTASFCGSVVLQRQKRFKYLTNVSGTRQLPYWAGNYAFDLIIFYVPLILFFILIYAIGDNGTFLTRFIGLLVPVLILFGFSFIGYSYLFSFVFQKSTTAFRFFPFANLIFFYFLPLIPSIVDGEGFLAQYLMPLLSPFVAFSAFFNTQEVVGSNFGQTVAFNKLFVPYTCLAIQSLVYLLINLSLQSLRFSLKDSDQEQQLLQQYQQNYQQPQIPAQRNSVRNSAEGYRPIQITNLTKIYGNGYLAVRNNSFTVRPKQIFGLLGPNGAGKSTTFNIATAALAKSSGSVKIFNEEVNKGIMQIFQNVGVCPQYNPIYQNMTVYQHLQYFALIKGIPSHVIPPTIEFYSELLSLTPYLHVNAGVLSGGNKRKMCVGMAMIGNPKVAFFDQPSAGVDPISRRYLWKCLSASAKSKQTAMVLTTHSMNEAESLCSQIGILIKGQFVCLDSPKNLKQRYGKGYRINVNASAAYHQELTKLMKEQFGEDVQIQKIDSEADFIVFIIKNSKFCLSKAFQIFEDNLTKKGKIQRYEIKQSTLEQVFIHLSKLQPQVEQQTYQEPWQLLCWQWGNNGCQLTI